MSEHHCEQCGAENAPDAQFCTKCDFYLGWNTGDGSLGGAPLTAAVPVVRETHTQRFAAPTADRSRRPDPPRVSRPGPASGPASAPTVTIEHPEVELDPTTGGSVDIRIRNKSAIVDGYTVIAAGAPKWLDLQHPQIRLLTDEEETTTVTLTIRPGFDVYVQRFRLRVQVCSIEDPAKRTDAELIVTVPRVGGPITMTSEPQVVRLRDQTRGRFRVRLDNTGSNYPQRYSLSGADPENVVRFAIRPQVVEVPPRGVIAADVQFDTPPIDYGQQAPRTLKITAASDQVRVEALVNVVQERSQAPADSPVRLRLERTVTRLQDATSAEIAVIIDNRRGSRDRRLVFSGRDPEGVVRFAFSQPQIYVRAGEQARIQASVQAPLPHPGQQVERPIMVVCNDGTDESEATGSLVQAASTSPMTTAQLRLEPEHVSVRNRRRGRFRVTVDNTRGALPLSAWLSGTDPEGAVRFVFNPQRVDVAPGQNGVALLQVWANLPGAGKEIARELTVRADDGTGSVEDHGRFTQTMSEILPLIRLAATLLGGLLMVLGAVRPWFLGGPTFYASYLTELGALDKNGDLNRMFAAIESGAAPNHLVWMQVSQPVLRAVILVLAGVMLLGILSPRGRYTIVAGILAVLAAVVYIVFTDSKIDANASPGYGVILVVAGAIIGIIGGFCIRRGNSG
ncbi:MULTISPECIES: zinc ribbon domain-containing protein [unclassified Mycolicibacterium]|uniref:zinc ribbon domain-containing protein n=1 Tax=unclassified Mycolicibacterium TaxID=2636767 RepID=UPI002ED91723